MRLFYFILLIVSVAFYLLYQGILSFVLLACVVLLPFVLLIMMLITASGVRVTAQFEQLSAQRGSSVVLKITVINNSVFPVSSCIADVVYKPLIPFEKFTKNKFRLSAPLGSRASETFILNISSAHCGVIDVAVKKIRIRDIMGLFSVRIKARPTGRIFSLPVIYPILASVEGDFASSPDSNAFSPVKSGDDPSEIFALREYREGDSNNRIHWKLSSRSDTFIVKELSLPVGCKALIITDFFGCKDASSIDRILEAAFSVSHFLTEYGAAHCIAYARSDYTIQLTDITDSDKQYPAVTEICTKLRDVASEFTFAQAASKDDIFCLRKSFSRVIAVASATDIARAEELSILFGEARLTIICTDSPDESKADDEYRAEIIYADAEKLSIYELLTI